MNQYTATAVSADALYQLLQAGSWPWLYAERMEGTELLRLAEALAAALPWTRWAHGRAFGPESQLTWWRQADAHYQLHLLTEGVAPGGNIAWQAGEPLTADPPYQSLLFGTYDDDSKDGVPSWSEARIPRRLHYPLPADSQPAAQVALRLQNLRYHGVAIGTRLLAVEPMSPGS